MPRTDPGYAPRPEGLQVAATPNIQAEQARFDPRGDKAFQLAEALGKAQPVIDEFNRKYEADRLREQEMRIPAYREQFLKDAAEGPVTAAQVGQRFPETVPVIRARVAESMGAERGKQATQQILQEIMQDANLQLNTEARAAFIKQRREELIGKNLGDGNEFYASGFISSVDKELNQYENRWLAQTAQYHKEVQEKDFSGKIVEALSTGKPGETMLALDATWAKSSSLSNLDRNKLVVDTVTKEAFASDNPAMLDVIPTRFLNADTKAQIQRTRAMIQEKRMTTVRDAEWLRQQQEKNQTRNDEIEMISKLVAGQDIDPAQYRNRPESFAKALSIKDADRIPAAQSTANLQKLRTGILNISTTRGLDQDQVVAQILAAPGLNNMDKKKLIDEAPKLIEGTIAMQDEMVKSAYSTRIGASLDALERSTNFKIASIVTGQNLRGQAVGLFDNGIRRGFLAYYEENGRWPTGNAKQQIVDQTVEQAEKFIANQMKLTGSTEKPQASTSGTAKSTSGSTVRKWNPATGKLE